MSELSSTSTKNSTIVKMNIKTGCAGLSLRSKEVVFESSPQTSNKVSKEEINENIIGAVVKNLIAVPMFNESENAIGVFELINTDPTCFSSDTTKKTLTKIGKYVSLLFYTSRLLKVKHLLLKKIEYTRKL